jgi:hypothetical protein
MIFAYLCEVLLKHNAGNCSSGTQELILGKFPCRRNFTVKKICRNELPNLELSNSELLKRC